MKTTIELAPALLRRAKPLLHGRECTLRDLIEEGLALAIEARREKRPSFELHFVGFNGEGLNPEFDIGGWGAIRAALYGDA